MLRFTRHWSGKWNAAPCLMLFAASIFAQAASKPLGRMELLVLVAGGMDSSLLAKKVQQRGVSFQPTGNFLQTLRKAGAEDTLLTALSSAKNMEHDGSGNSDGQEVALEHVIRAIELDRNHFHPCEAEPEYRAAAQADPASAFTHLGLAKTLLRLGQLDAAYDEFHEAARLQPDLAQAHFGLANSLWSQHNLHAALQELEEAVRLEPDDAALHRSLASALQANGDHRRALEEEQLASQLAPLSLTPKRIRVGGNVMQSRRLSAPAPDYPPEARNSGVQGVVRLAVLIGIDGAVEDSELISGDPALAQAATQAVLKWRYKPITINRQPIEVITEIDINFRF